VNARPTCTGGMCGTQCVAPAIDCAGVCQNVQTNPAHCGQCNRICSAPANGTGLCANGTCSIACDSGYSLCGGACRNTQTDKQNCGGCGIRCMGNLQCVAGSCVQPNRD
jgi:hypothetical protein